jgi:polyvinyl alcohol dehydrogenase (cytochrome)
MVSLRVRRGLLAAPILAALIAAVPSAPDAPGAPAKRARCAKAKVPGGQWRSYGHDFSNTRTQKKERKIGSGNVGQLGPAWTFSTVEAGGEGDITGTPIVAYGCVYVATSDGWVFAMNARTGKLRWKRKVPQGGSIQGSVLATRKRVYVGVHRSQLFQDCAGGDPCRGPYVVALNRRNGRVVWASRPLDRQRGTDLYASPVIFKGVLMIGVSGGIAELSQEGGERDNFQGSMNFLDARTGRILKKTWTIHPPKRPRDDFAGGGIWGTPAIDRKTMRAYVGTANPYVTRAQHPRTNSILKFDVNRRSRTFGKILSHYEGTREEYLDAFSDMPCIDFPGNVPPYPTGAGSCGDLDLDFGASPNLFRIGKRKVVGAGQKSGIYHVFDRRTMKPLWTQALGPPSQVGGIVGSTAYERASVFGPLTYPGYVWSVSAESGSVRWATPTGDGLHWGNPVSVANGVVYTTTFSGFLDAYDAETGLLLARKRLPDVSWGGVSIARNTVYASVGTSSQSEGFVVAFRLGGGGGDAGGGGGDGGGGEGGGDPPSNPPIVAGPGASSSGYATPAASTGVGGPLTFNNLDVLQHDVTADQAGPDGRPLFWTELIGLGETAEVQGLDRVQSGQTYGFFCTLHPGMRGQLAVR